MRHRTYSLLTGLIIGTLFFACSDSEDDNPLPDEGEWSSGPYEFNSLSPKVFDFVEVGNGLRLELTQNAIWFQDDQAGLLFTELTGDFSLTATVRAQRASDASSAPDCNVCLGGLMARNPSDVSGENYVHIVVGRNPAGVGVETKTTVNGVSEFTPYDDNLAEAELRIAREGSAFTLYRRDVGSTRDWLAVETYDRPDLPQTLQVGFNIYTSVSGASIADLSMVFEDIGVAQ